MLIQLTEPGAAQAPSGAIIGIDFGTTHSVVAWAPPNEEVRVLSLENETPLVPSVFSPHAENVLVGHAALHHEAVFSVKRAFEDPTLLPLHEAIQGATYILKHLKEQTQKALSKPVTHAVLTVPAYFSERARSAVRLAAHQAGLSVLRLLNEPTAAALAYGMEQLHPQGLILVYDLGGGTFDVSLLRLTRGIFQVVATGGDVALGGDDIDALIQHDIGGDPSLTRQQARKIKEDLTLQDQGTWEIAPGTFYHLTRERLEELMAPLIDRTWTLTQGVLKDAHVLISDITEILLVGGATRIPLVTQRLTEAFGRPPCALLDPDLSVAKGAALQARALSYGSDTLLLDVTPLSLSLETLGGKTEKIILRNSPLPASSSHIFTTSHDHQSGIVVHVLQGEASEVDQCRSLGRFVLQGLPPLPAGAPRITITFTLDAEGLLTVTAQEPTLNLFQQLELVPGQNLTHQELQKLLQKA